MKHTWLFCAGAFLCGLWSPYKAFSICLFLLFIVYYVRHYHFHIACCILLIGMGFFVCMDTDQKKPTTSIFTVKEMKQGYVTAYDGHQKVLLYTKKTLNFDDVVEVRGEYQKIDTIHNIREFNFRKWCNRRHIYYQIQCKQITVLKKGHSLRANIFADIQHIQQREIRDWLNATLFGIHKNDVSYFVTSSGMHINYLIHIFQKFCMLICSRSIASFLSILSIMFLGYSTYFSSSLIRLLLFRFVYYLYPNDNAMDRLGKSMCLTLFLFPYMAYEMAFLLPVLFQLCAIFMQTRRAKSITSCCVMIPMQFLYFHTCNIIQILCFRYIRMIYAFAYMNAWLFLLTRWQLLYDLVKHILQIMERMEQIGFSFHYTPSFIWLMLWTYYAIRYISNHKQRLFPLCLLFVITPFTSYIDPFGEVYMIDVGQGDCTLVVLPFHKGVMLIDVMGSLYKNIPKDIIVPVLQSRGITAIDKVIITHDDYDHDGGLKELQALIDIKEVVQTKREGIQLDSLHIPFVLKDYKGNDENDNSIITYMEVYGLRFLFMGDGSEVCEKEILRLYPKMEVDILKVGHHGSKTSSSLPFLHQLHPQIALISAGRHNRYHHPNEETLKRLENEDIYALSTLTNGGVSIKFCKYFAFYRTADNEFGIIKNR